MNTFNTRDLGMAIRDHIEEHTVTHFGQDANGDTTEEEQSEVAFVDASDPNNLIVSLDNGQTFTVRIFAGE